MNLSIIAGLARLRSGRAVAALVASTALLAFFARPQVAAVAYAVVLRGTMIPDTLPSAPTADRIGGPGSGDQIYGKQGGETLLAGARG
jgi:hypothetical protein